MNKNKTIKNFKNFGRMFYNIENLIILNLDL